MTNPISRRQFLHLAGIGMTSLAFRPSYDFGELQDNDLIARVGTTSVSVYSRPDDTSLIRFQRYRDEIVNIYSEVMSEKNNPLWYRVWGGYILCGNMQRVHVNLNSIPSSLPEGLHAIEITVPYSLCYLQRKQGNWEPLFRLYYSTVHWAVGIVEGPDGEPWFRIKDESFMYDSLDYYVPAQHARLIPLEETTPISPDVPPDQKYIEVSLQTQDLTAYEQGKVVLQTKISSGQNYKPPGKTPWNTPKGRFVIQTKMPSKHMGDDISATDPEAYNIPGVSWVSFFEVETGVAFHGTHWHQNYGAPMSHGCINMKPEEAKWLYRWTTPVGDMTKMTSLGYGTQVHVF